MACGFCKNSGHTIRTCTAHGVDGMRKANADRAEEKRRVRDAKDFQKYCIQDIPIPLESPVLYPGSVNVIYAKDCQSVDGAITTSLPVGFLCYTLRLASI